MTYKTDDYSQWVHNTSSPKPVLSEVEVEMPGEVSSSPFSFIGGGSQNCIDTNSASGSYYGVIGGGYQNIICAGTCFSSIVGGLCNTNSGYYSAILGGACNTISNVYQYAGVFGCNINAAASCTFHTNCLNACNTPPYGGFAPGTIVYITCGDPIPMGAKALYII